MVQWTTGNINSRGTDLHYYRSGGSMPPMVLSHGITDDGLCWTPVAEVLSARYDVIMVDARGHGKSAAPDHGYNYKTMAAELAGLITGLGLEHPILLGHSMGAAISLVLAGLFPELPGAILLEDPVPLWETQQPYPEEDERRAAMIAWMTSLKRMTRADLLSEVRQLNPTWPEAELGPWADSKHRFSLKIISLLDPEDETDAGIPELIQQITCPVLLITADPKRGAILAEDDAVALRELLPQLEVANIPAAGHNIRREHFATYIDVIRHFLIK
jgi:N-formylmaleamate deformylase